VFNEIVAKQLKAWGYYDDKYWSQVQVSKGITFVTETEEERRYRDKVNTMDNKMQCMSGVMKLWLSFMSQKYPNDDLIKRMERALHDEVSLHGSMSMSPSVTMSLFISNNYLYDVSFFCRLFIPK
jgi:hypothetical protein